MMRHSVVWIAMLGLGAPAFAQGDARPHAELPSADQPTRVVPVTGYTLALTWGPEFCFRARGARAADPQCRNRLSRSGFTLHGLWPDGDGPNRWPQYCHPVAILTDAEIAGGRSATPSPQLLQHEWAKHGSCMAKDAGGYFAEETKLYRALTLPRLDMLARQRNATAADVGQAIATANPQVPPAAIRVTANRSGWLSEVWLCLDRRRQYQPCGTGQEGGIAADAPIKIAVDAQPQRFARPRY